MYYYCFLQVFYSHIFRCDIIIHLFEDAQKVAVQEQVCNCGAQMVNVEYKEDKTKLANDAKDMTGCIFCSQQFSNLVEKHKAIASRKVNIVPKNASRGRGRRKPRPPKDKMSQLAAYFVWYILVCPQVE